MATKHDLFAAIDDPRAAPLPAEHPVWGQCIGMLLGAQIEQICAVGVEHGAKPQLGALPAEVPEAQPAKRARKGKADKRAAAASSKAQDAPTDAQVLAAVQANPRALAGFLAAKVLHCETAPVSKALSRLIRDGRASVEGVRRGKRYFAAEAPVEQPPGEAAPPTPPPAQLLTANGWLARHHEALRAAGVVAEPDEDDEPPDEGPDEEGTP